MNCRFHRPKASIRLFCFPWAGGRSNFFTNWGQDTLEDIEVLGVCLPGRENRMEEPLRGNAEEAVDELVSIIHNDYSDKPFMFFGHSVGSLLAFNVAVKLKTLYNKEPKRMFVSGSFAPQSHKIRDGYKIVAFPKKMGFFESLRYFGGIPQNVMENKEMLDRFLSLFHADCCMIEGLMYDNDKDETPPLSCPIDFFDADQDRDFEYHEWQDLTSGSFTCQTIHGGHLYIKEQVNLDKVIYHINQRYEDDNM